MNQHFGGNCQGKSRPIWEIAADNNAKKKVVREHKCKDASYFAGC